MLPRAILRWLLELEETINVHPSKTTTLPESNGGCDIDENVSQSYAL